MARSRKHTRTTPAEDTSTLERQLARRTTLWLSAFAVIFAYFLIRYMVLKLPVIPTYRLGPLRVNSFGPLVALGVLFGVHLIRHWCVRFNLQWSTLQEGLVWIVGIGFVVAHLMAVSEYNPANLFDLDKLLAIRSGFSAYGGFLGGAMTTVLFLTWRRLPVRPYVDCVLYGLIGGWLFGRLACFSIHDHPGIATSLPVGMPMHGVMRHDLGFYELVFTLGLFIYLTLATRKHPRFPGFVVAVAALTYAPVRFLLDFLRINDPLYAGLTVAQWSCIPLLAIGIESLINGRRR